MKAERERVWIMCAIALGALFLMRGVGVVFAGAITGLGMFVAVYVLLSWFPLLRNVLFGFGGIVDIAISFGLPYIISCVLEIKGTTLLIATLTCGLLFTFILTTSKMGGIVSAAKRSGLAACNGLFDQFRKEVNDGRTPEVGLRSRSRTPRARMRRQREEDEAEDGREGAALVPFRGLRKREPDGSVLLVEGEDYYVK